MNDLLKLILNEFKLVFKKKKHVSSKVFLYRQRFARRRLNLKAKIGHRVRHERSGSQVRRNVTGPFCRCYNGVGCGTFAVRFAL